MTDDHAYHTILRRLVTKEDPCHVHKTLGLSCLLHFVYRYAYCLRVHGTLGYQDTTSFNALTSCMHMGLSSTSLVFHVLSKRMKTRPLIIYQEYRLHTILFTLRSCMWHFIPKWYHGVDLVPVGLIIIHGLVDAVSRVHGTDGMTTVRVEDESHHTPTVMMRRVFSYYQIVAIACLLSSSDHDLANISFNLLIAIQSSTFLMTLVRKNIIRPQTHIVVYGASLMLSTATLYDLTGPSVFVGALCVFLLRMRGISKYVLWTAFYCTHLIGSIVSGV